MMEDTANQAINISIKKYFPIVTALVCAICLVLFIGVNLDGPLDMKVYKKWGSPSAIDIFNGDLWGLLTSNFLHTELWHIAANLYWFWRFGKKIEFETKKAFYVFFVLSSALVSSLAQLAFSNTTGIGLSGIGYAFFGFIYIRSKTNEEYRNFLERSTINLFLFWLVLCVILTRTGAWNVGNAAHLGGLFWGVLVAYIARYERQLRWSIGFIYLAILSLLIIRGPFSTAYLSYQAYELHTKGNVKEAIEAYKKILKRDPDSEFAKENLKQLELYPLQEKALELHQQGKYHEARQLYDQILKLDKDNEWAKANLSILPIGN
jgi:GlpG protein